MTDTLLEYREIASTNFNACLHVPQAQLPGLSLTLPTTIFGVCALVAGILSLWLPETLNEKLPQTIEEAEATVERYGASCCGLDCRRRRGGVQLAGDDNEHL